MAGNNGNMHCSVRHVHRSDHETSRGGSEIRRLSHFHSPGSARGFQLTRAELTPVRDCHMSVYCPPHPVTSSAMQIVIELRLSPQHDTVVLCRYGPAPVHAVQGSGESCVMGFSFKTHYETPTRRGGALSARPPEVYRTYRLYLTKYGRAADIGRPARPRLCGTSGSLEGATKVMPPHKASLATGLSQ